jgi:hypothetical protein
VSDRSTRVPFPGRILGWLLVIVSVALAARLVWELLAPLLPVVVCLLIIGGVLWSAVRRVRRSWQ